MYRTLHVVTLIALAVGSNTAAKASIEYDDSFNLFDPGADAPFYSSNAFFRKENFYGQDSVRYWQPASPNRFAEIVYKVNTPSAIETATLKADLWGYQYFDRGALAYLDVSTDFSNWNQIAEAGPGGPFPGPEYHNDETFDISPYVQGSDEVYVRARLYTTRSSSSGSYGVSQWLRTHTGLETPTFEFRSTHSGNAVPEPTTWGIWTLLSVVGFACCRKRRLVRSSRHVPSRIGFPRGFQTHSPRS